MRRRRLLAGAVLGLCLLGLALALWLPLQSRPTTNVLLITLDTTRADRLGCYGYRPAQTPALDALAAGGVLFERAYAPTPLTLPSHASLLTGLYPPEHGLRTNARGRLDDELPTLAALLAERGYDTAAFVASFVLDAKFGLARGFATYDDNLQGAEPTLDSLHRQRDGGLVVDSALSWLKRERSAPFFCWVHLYDPHMPYRDHAERYGDRFRDRPYDAEIAYVDEQVARLLEFLASRRLDENTLVVVVGDHGEGLGEHVELTHGFTLYNSTQHVPLIVRTPTPPSPNPLPQGEGRAKVSNASHRVDAPVALVDVFATILDVLGITPPPGISGRSVRAALEGKAIAPADCYAATDDPFLQNGWSPLKSLTTSDWKYIRTTEPELYDLRADPGETRNLAESQPAQVQAMEQRLAAMEAAMPYREAADAGLSAADRKKLASLGYAAGGTEGRPGTGESAREAFGQSLPDVKQMLPYDVQSQRALDLLSGGDADGAIALLEKVVHETSAHVASRVFLGNAYEQNGELDRAVAAYRQALGIKPDYVDAHMHLGHLWIAQGRLPAAISHFRDAVRIDPESAQAHYNLGLALDRDGQHLDALAHFNQAIRIDPALADVHAALGNLLAAMGQSGEAVEQWRRELEINPRAVEARVNLGVVLTSQGRTDEALTHLTDAVKFSPENVQANYNLGVLMMIEKRFPEAVRQFERVLELQPGHPQARDQLERARRN